MIHKLQSALLCGFLAVCGALCAGPAESTVMVAGFNYGVVMKGTGSGFVIAPETVVTAGHCVKMGTSMRVRDPQGHWHDATVLRSGSPDWAVMHVAGLKAPALDIDRDGVKRGERLTAYGRFGIRDLRTANGRKTGWTMKRGWDCCTAPVYQGFSGGPVCDADGEVVGIVSMTVGGAACLYVPITDVR